MQLIKMYTTLQLYTLLWHYLLAGISATGHCQLYASVVCSSECCFHSWTVPVPVGLDAAGKTTILYKLKLGEVVTTIPTIGEMSRDAVGILLRNVVFTNCLCIRTCPRRRTVWTLEFYRSPALYYLWGGWIKYFWIWFFALFCCFIYFSKIFPKSLS